jgi:DNA-binding IclR family transcriptional regulator
VINTATPPLPREAAEVLGALQGAVTGAAVRLNELVEATGLPTGHVGRHLRTLERDRLARFESGGWRLTRRGAGMVGQSEPAQDQ